MWSSGDDVLCSPTKVNPTYLFFALQSFLVSKIYLFLNSNPRDSRQKHYTMSALTVLFIAACSLFITASPSMAQAVNEGDCICREGIIMDRFCINLGTLLDNPSARTLVNPELHSQHCLLDVSVCVQSGFTILGDPDRPGGLYSVAAQFDANGDEKIFAFAARNGRPGFCRACTGELGSVTNGFRASVVGVVLSAGNPYSNDALARTPLIKVTDVLSSSAGCANFSCPNVAPVPIPNVRPPPQQQQFPPSPQPGGLVAAVNAPSDIVIDWTIPFGQPSLPSAFVTEGDTMIFNWSGPIPHNVFNNPAGGCDMSSATLLGETSGTRYTFQARDVGEMTFVCGIPGHCVSGQIISVFVRARPAPLPAPPTPRPPTPRPPMPRPPTPRPPTPRPLTPRPPTPRPPTPSPPTPRPPTPRPPTPPAILSVIPAPPTPSRPTPRPLTPSPPTSPAILSVVAARPTPRPPTRRPPTPRPPTPRPPMLAASGIPELTPQQVNKSIGCNGAELLLDVRSQQEWDSGHHPGATHAESLAERGLIFFPEILNCVNCRIIVVSFLGERATRAANMLVAAGFRDVFIGGGTFHWIMDGFSLVEGDSMPAMCSNNGCQARTTTALCNVSARANLIAARRLFILGS